MEQAQRIAAALRRKVELCGVFVNAPLEQVVRTSEELGLTMLQLHGDEGPAFCVEAARRTGAKVVKAAQVAAPAISRTWSASMSTFTCSTRARRRPGSRVCAGNGETFDWELLAGRRSKVPLILSGGLGPGNVAARRSRKTSPSRWTPPAARSRARAQGPRSCVPSCRGGCTSCAVECAPAALVVIGRRRPASDSVATGMAVPIEAPPA